jgi:uncharacterized protein (UPF0297 family)
VRIVPTSNPPMDELTHHGVKGMKWGVRKAREKQANANVDAYVADVHSQTSYATREISEKEYKSLSSKPVKLGNDFLRIAGKNPGKFRDIVYVSKTADDHNRYKAILAPGNNARSKRFDVSIKTAQEAFSPSKKERIDTFIKTLGQDVPDPSGKISAKGRDWMVGVDPDSPYRALSNREVGLQTYQQFAQKQVLNTPLHQAYFNNLKEKGYNALVDDADAGVVSRLPVIIFPNESGARVTEIKPVSRDELTDARLGLKLLDRRKGAPNGL